MQEKILFKNKVGSFVTNLQLKEKLEELNAHKCDILYVHTALSFGVPQVKRVELLDELFAVFALLRIPTLIFPTFTFSFPNGEDYDVQDSKTSMGIFNEYFRKQNGVIRSVDPLMSNALLGKHVEFVSKIGKNSCGKDSTFDMLHKSELNVKFLFFGTRIGDCFTFMHYIEDELHVSYRYSCPFTGKITNQNKSYIDTYYLPVR
jgi:aminoglycoside 3-N-acetyltransferase